jgi:fibro-slime domain-containing protein
MAIIQLTAKVRDFRADHPDFENKREPEETGLVLPILGDDNKPVFNETRSPRSLTVTNKSTFDQWFRHVPGVNAETEIQLDLDNSMGQPGGTYRFHRPSFFPIDDQLFGTLDRELFQLDSNGLPSATLSAVGDRLKAKKNQNPRPEDRFNLTTPAAYRHPDDGKHHNYHFTLETSAKFTYQGTEEFVFEGDDDLWVFIGNQSVGGGKRGALLAIDLGGVHAAARRTLNLRLNNPQNQAADKSRSLRLNLRQHLGLQVSEAYAPLNLELTVGETYEFFFFFAERHTHRCSFRIETSLLLRPLPRVRIEATQPNAVEPTPYAAAVPGQFRISLVSGETAPAGGLWVRYRLKELPVPRMAIANQDFILSSPSMPPSSDRVLIPAGQSSVLLNVTPLDNNNPHEGREEVCVELLGYENGGYQLGDRTEDTVFIANYAPPLATVQKLRDAIEPRPSETMTETHVGLFEISLAGDLPLENTPVRYRVIETPGLPTAAPGQDYEPLSGTVTVNRATRKAQIRVVAKADMAGNEGIEHVTVELLPQVDYRIPAMGEVGRTATLSITDPALPPPPPPLARIYAVREALEPRPGEALTESHVGLFEVHLEGAILQDNTTVRYRVIAPADVRNATSGQDYEPLSGVVMVNRATRKAQIRVVAKADVAGDELNPEEYVALELAPDLAYRLPIVGQHGRSDRIRILDRPLPPPLPIARIRLSRNAWEPRPGEAIAERHIALFEVNLEGPLPSSPITVRYRVITPPNLPHATFGQDYEPLSGVVQIDAASRTAYIPVVAKADVPGDEAATPEYVVLELLPDATYRVPNPGEQGRTAAVVITDIPIATLQATQRWTQEPQNAQAQRNMRPQDKGKFVVTVRPKPPAPIFVNYVVNRSARKAAQPRDYILDPPQRVRINPQTGQGIIWVTPQADNQDEDNERVVLQLRPGDGYLPHLDLAQITDVVVIQDKRPRNPVDPKPDPGDVVFPQPT